MQKQKDQMLRMEDSMEYNNSKIYTFTDLYVWQESHKLVLMIYTVTKKFPKEEIFGITSQMRRSAVSITSNIAEGFARRSKKEKLQFYTIARGSLIELESQLLVVRDILYIQTKEFEEVYRQIEISHRLLNAFINKTNDL
ncbi:MAG: S23 ribosomal protein [Parcubacteria group bacterium GW2011_GWA1_47_8]|nr:MAG: S23 ribosomal protein [Parcubacteria group bacterium GW2011_GWA1_47_8]